MTGREKQRAVAPRGEETRPLNGDEATGNNQKVTDMLSSCCTIPGRPELCRFVPDLQQPRLSFSRLHAFCLLATVALVGMNPSLGFSSTG